uniref:WAT1-related protein n=1 Tax=Fagus sylvatica TaxID=28930 RepID=A0A2N9E4G4_FAGSY
MAMGLFYYGLRDTNATYATNFLNLIPIFTFVFSTILRIEKLGLKTRAGQVKTLGAIFCFAGALTTSLYKGKAFHIGHHSLHSTISLEPSEVHWTRGTFMLVGSCFSYAAWYIVQGALGTAVTFSLVSWAIAIRGPTYPPMFSPLTLICVALLEALILGAEIRLGSMLGTVLIIIGLYSFLWGKRKEMKSLKLVTKNDATGVIAPAATIPDESAVVQSTSILMPSPLSEYGVMDVQEDSDKSTLTPKLLMI